MCGISGFAGPFEAALLERMSASLAHRGPDDSGTWISPDGLVGLAHRRLSIIDLSAAGHQPMWDATGTLAIAYNGELYNFRELRKELVEQGFAFRSQSDTEVVLNLFLRDGDAMLPRLNGIFAFAIFDRRSQEVFIARDAIGVKPLYYAELPEGVLFASELKAVLQERRVPRDLDPHALRSHLVTLWSPSPRTALRAVSKLPPGFAMRVRDGRVKRRWQYYDLPYDQPIEEMNEGEAVERVHDAIELAVRRQLVADVPVGAFLSGGLDSSSVAAFAQRELAARRLQCFTIGFEDPAARAEGMALDLPYARRAAEHLGVDLHTIWVGPEMADELPRMLYHLDEPQPDPAPINALFISRLAREHGIKVLLSGAGGDDLFTGYRRHHALLRESAWSWLPRPARRMLRAGARRLPQRSNLLRRVSKALQYAPLDGDARIASYFYWIAPGQAEALLHPDLRRALESDPAPDPLIAALAGLGPQVPALNRMLYLEGKYFLVDHNLNYTDKMSMACGVEVRVPFLDPDLVALAARLPLRFKQHGATGKYVMKRAMERHLPRDIIYRPKAGFGAPLRHWLRGPLRPLVEDLLSPAVIDRRGLFDAAAVRRLAEEDRAGRADGAYTLFAVLCIELWCRSFVDPATPRLPSA